MPRWTGQLMTVITLWAVLVGGCSRAPAAVGGGQVIPQPEASVLETYDPGLTQQFNVMGIRLLSTLFDSRENLLLSPISIATALAMTYNGARGSTREAMAAVLGVSEIDLERLNENSLALLYLLQEAGEVTLDVANSLWLRTGIPLDKDFMARIQHYYAAPIHHLDFADPAAAAQINRWVQERTGGLIEEIVAPPIDPLTLLFLINAIYFQGNWTSPFDASQTQLAPFHLLGEETRTVPFMERYSNFAYYREGEMEAVRLGYGNDARLAMYVFVPPTLEALQDLITSWATGSNRPWEVGFRSSAGTVRLPRFSLAYEQSLRDALTQWGMGVAFQPGEADFLAMVPWEDEPQLYISEVKHKAFIEVSEAGTEAAAVTSVEIGVTSIPLTPFTFVADRPFVFLIYDELTEALLFVGVLVDPGA